MSGHVLWPSFWSILKNVPCTLEENVYSAELKGIDGAERIQEIMKNMRSVDREKYGIVNIIDYKNDNTGLPKSDVLSYTFENGDSFIVRPSGTEPKIKLYMNTVGKTKDDANSRGIQLQKKALEMCGL